MKDKAELLDLLKAGVRFYGGGQRHRRIYHAHKCDGNTDITPNRSLHWIVSLASDVETRAVQVIVTSAYNLDGEGRPHDTSDHGRNAYVVDIGDMTVPEWLDKFTYALEGGWP